VSPAGLSSQTHTLDEFIELSPLFSQKNEHLGRFSHLSRLKGEIVGLSEHFLVWRLRRGDPEACRELIRRHHPGVYGYLRRLGAAPDLAEDLTQETYAKVWLRIGTLRRTASLRSWLLTIARNEFLQCVRVDRPEVEADGELTDRRGEAPQAEDELLRSERHGELRRAVSGLEPALQETVALHYFQGLSLREVGSVMGLPTGTVKSRVNRALGQLRERLETKEAEHGTERVGKALARDS
jgi:RNA polymerase sigma-70 factor (ECF subfamily)